MSSRIRFLATAALVLAVHGAHANETIAGRDVASWLPDDGAPKPWPVVVFSHGLHGCAAQSVFLTRALGHAGYAVFAPNHRDAACRDLTKWREVAAKPLGDPGAWSDTTYADRRDDVVKLLDALAHDGRFDLGHVALVGHSLGGYTALGVGGAWPAWKDVRVKAVVALSPYVQPFVQKHTLDKLGVPVMYQSGTLDIGVMPFIVRPGGAWELTAKPRALVIFQGAGHFAWTELRQQFQAEIVAYTAAFLDHELRGRPIPEALTKAHADATTVKLELTP